MNTIDRHLWPDIVADTARKRGREVLVVVADDDAVRDAIQEYQARYIAPRVRADVLGHRDGGIVRFVRATGPLWQVLGTLPWLVVILGGSGPVVDEARIRALHSDAPVLEAR